MLTVLRWLALLSGSLVLAFVLFIAGADIVGALQEGRGLGFGNSADGFRFFLFPFSLIIGLALAYKWELLGGAVVVGSMALLCILRHDLFASAFFLWGTPGALYLAHALLMRRSVRVQRR